MKNCPLCGHEYYDEANWCPECEYDFPAGEATAPPTPEEVATVLAQLEAHEAPTNEAAVAVARRISELFRAAGEDANRLWRLSTDHLTHVREYEMAVALWGNWRQARK